jgi:NAD(P)H-dependent FMN reductase
MQILLLSGSVRRGSTSEAVLRTVAELAPPGVTTILFDGVGELPHFNPDDDREPLPPPVAELRRAIDAADALLVCTPEYAGALPGSFKNLLDWTVGGIETNGKRAAWINASASGADRAHDELRTVLTYTGCEIVEAAIIRLPVGREAIRDGVVVTEDLRRAIAAAVEALM